MYNRYVPQPDGSFQRNRMAEPPPPPRPTQERREPPREQPCPPEPKPGPAPGTCQGASQGPSQGQSSGGHRPPRRPPPRRDHCGGNGGQGIFGFFRGLLPRGLDTEDLIIVLLLLLMAGDCQEDQNRALLTLALYLFL